MVTRHIASFLHKPWPERIDSTQFLIRQWLSKMPYVPVLVKLRISDDEELKLRWSYIAPFQNRNGRFFDYWGQDLAELRFVWKFLKPGMVFLDIGAHHGIFTLVAAKRMGGDGRIVAFEPSPRELGRLKLHLRWNRVRSARAEPYALASTASDSKFHQVISGDIHCNSLRSSANAGITREIVVRTISLDQYASEAALDRVDLLKLDIEGGELDALTGAKRILSELRPMIICEVLDATSRTWGHDAREIISMLRGMDFEWFAFNADGTVSAHEIKDLYPEIKNYLAVPQEKNRAGIESLFR